MYNVSGKVDTVNKIVRRLLSDRKPSSKYIIIIIIIITITSVTSWALIDLFRPRLTVSSRSSKSSSSIRSTIQHYFWASCCCSFLLRVVANLIWIFLVPRQPFLLPILPKFLHSFCGQRVSSSKIWGDYLLVCVCLCVKEKFRDFWSSPNIRNVMSRTMRTAHVARTGEK